MTFVLVPGAGGSAWTWHRVVPRLRDLGHDAIAVDLPAADESAGLTEYADAIVEAAAGHDDIVLVAHSLAGFSAPLACDRLPVSELVLVNAMIPAPGETAGDWWANTGQERARREQDAREGRDPDAELDLRVYFFHDVPPDITEEAMRTEQRQAERIFTQPWPLPAWPDVPTRVLTAQQERFFPAGFQAAVARQRLGLTPEPLPGGHLVALSHPDELVARLLG
ncbi:alpha/beta hydrolase [Dactylosporangium salmoneum]|uniref:Alpha/beta fold hydrolase n=1 Tax=Dactylosporangium salmoneum TaxID=53361 RepID=A0ABN3H4X5_9ACTN